jgi:hypothetical protein
MSRRFNDEPINLIRRIPSPEQLSAARPGTRSFSQTLVDTGAAFVRSAMGLFAPPAQPGPPPETQADAGAASPDVPAEHSAMCPGEESNTGDVIREQAQAVAVPSVRNAVNFPQSDAPPAGAQREEINELRAYLLSQQQDIARLAEQVQELKSLVVSQQQVLVYLGKELEAGSMSRMTGSIASAVVKRNRPVRHKSVMKGPEIKERVVTGENDPLPSSLNV